MEHDTEGGTAGDYTVREEEGPGKGGKGGGGGYTIREEGPGRDDLTPKKGL